MALAHATSIMLPGAVHVFSVADLSDKDADVGVKAMLGRGAAIAVSLPGKQDGSWTNERVRISLPDWIQKFERAIKLLGKSKGVETMKLGVNGAAEQAVPQAKALLVAAVKAMSVQDAKAILTRGDNAVTQFFQNKTQTALEQKFLPVVTSRIAWPGNTIRLHNRFNRQASSSYRLNNREWIVTSPGRQRTASTT